MSNERKTLKCSVCAKVEGEFHLCANCQSSVYCSKECQKSDWKTHYKTCEKALEQYGVGDGTKRKDAPSSSLTSTSSSTTTTTTTVTKNNDDDDNDKNNNDDIEDADDNDDDVNDKQNASETTATVTIPSSSTNSTTTTTGTTSTNEKPSKKLKTGPSNKPVKEEGVPFITSSEGQHTLMDFPNGEAVYQIFHPNFPDVKFLNSEPTYKGLNEKYGLGIVNMLPNGQPEPDRKKPVDFKNPIFPFINVFGRWFDSVIRAYEYAKLASIGLVQIYDYAIAPLTLETAVVFVNKKDEQIEKDTPTFKFDSATGKTLLLKEAETSGADQLKLLAGGKPTQGQITSLVCCCCFL